MLYSAYLSIFLDKDSVEEKGKKTSRFGVIERDYSNKFYELGWFLIKKTLITKTINWPTLGPLAYTKLVPGCKTSDVDNLSRITITCYLLLNLVLKSRKKIIKNASVYEHFNVFSLSLLG